MITPKEKSDEERNGSKIVPYESDDDIVELDSSKEEPKRVISFPQADSRKDNDSDSDVLVIDIDDEVEEKKSELHKPEDKRTMKRGRKSTCDDEEKRPAQKRGRKSTSDDEEKRPASKRGRKSISDDEETKPPAIKAPRRSSANSAVKFDQVADQVENELEAMFAGIESEDCKDSEASRASEMPKIKKKPGRKPMSEEEKRERLKEKKANAAKKPRKNDKKSAKQLEKEEKEREAREKAANVSKQEQLLEKFKGPFVRVIGEVADPRWSNVVNYATDPLGPFDDQPDQLEQAARVTGFGYTLTTLSAKYDPRNVDESWICAFCRKQSHYAGLGDLFGPYFIPVNQWKGLNLPSPAKKSSDLASSFIIGGSDQAGAKAKRRQKKKLGAVTTESPTKSGKNDKSEVWFHEDCLVWMPQIRLIGSQLMGLSDAIRVSQKSVCSQCNFKGSTIACSQIRCRESAHFPCAQDLNWSLNEDTFLAKCHEHSDRNHHD